MITTTLCYSATLGSSVADYGKPCRVDMGNVGSKNLAPDSVSSTMLNFADDMAAIFSPALVSTSLNTGVGVGVSVDSFAPTNSHFRYN